MELNIDVTLDDGVSVRRVVKGRLQRHREDVAGDTEASFIIEWQIDKGDGDPTFLTTTVDLFDLTRLNHAALIAEALNGLPIGEQARTGDYTEVEPPLFRNRSEFGRPLRELLHLPKRGNRLE